VTTAQMIGYEYLIQQPDGLSSAGSMQQFPVLVYLHGAGEIAGEKVAQVKKHGPWKDGKFNGGAKSSLGNYFLIAPHIAAGGANAWDTQRLLSTVCTAFSEIKSKFGHNIIDPARLYVTGFSLGGRGALELAEAGCPNPAGTPCSSFQRVPFKAAAILCPLWGSSAQLHPQTKYQFFHREHDSNAPTRGTYEHLKKHANARFHRFAGTSHNCWSATYANPQLYDWLEDPTIAPDWGAACDFGYCADKAMAAIAVKPPIEALFCFAHAQAYQLGAAPWVGKYNGKIPDVSMLQPAGVFSPG